MMIWLLYSDSLQVPNLFKSACFLPHLLVAFWSYHVTYYKHSNLIGWACVTRSINICLSRIHEVMDGADTYERMETEGSQLHRPGNKNVGHHCKARDT